MADTVPQRGRLIVRDVKGMIEDLGKDRQHLLFELTMLLVELVEALFGGVGNMAHTLEEHLDQLVAGLHLGLWRKQSRRLQRRGGWMSRGYLPHRGRPPLRQTAGAWCGQSPEQRLRRQDRFQPGEAIRPLSEVLERRLAGGVFHPCELGPPVMDWREGVKPCLLGRSGGRDVGIQRLMYWVADMTHEAVERAERGQFEALLNEVLDRDVDQVRRGTHGQRGLRDMLRHQTGTTMRLCRDAQMAANEVSIARAQILRRVALGLWGQVELLAQILPDREGNRLEGRQIAQRLLTLAQRQERHAARAVPDNFPENSPSGKRTARATR